MSSVRLSLPSPLINTVAQSTQATTQHPSAPDRWEQPKHQGRCKELRRCYIVTDLQFAEGNTCTCHIDREQSSGDLSVDAWQAGRQAGSSFQCSHCRAATRGQRPASRGGKAGRNCCWKLPYCYAHIFADHNSNKEVKKTCFKPALHLISFLLMQC